MTFQPIGLGDRVKDPISGYQGIVVSVTAWLHGCIRVGVQAEALQDGKPVESSHFDQTQVVLVDAGVHSPQVLAVTDAPAAETRRSSGGPAREGARFSR